MAGDPKVREVKMAKEYLYLDDYQVGDRMISPARTVTEVDIVNFAALTGDWHPLHTDA
jgi:acyl dehydratase